MYAALNRKCCAKLFLTVFLIGLMGLTAHSGLDFGHNKRPRIEIEPAKALIDQEVTIKILGLAAGQEVTLRASMQDNRESTWESKAVFQASPDGTVDLAVNKAIQGTYEGVDPSGMFWSMARKTEGKGSWTLGEKELSPLVMNFTAEVNGKKIASASLERLYVSPGVKRQEVRENGLVGTFFQPAGKDKAPGLMIMGGSGGGLGESRAALLASHGFATLALAYFGMEELPKYLSEIPLEYFDKALQWLNSQEVVQDGKLGVMGASRGGELVLLLGATFSSIRAVVAMVPSGIVHGGFPTEGSAWTYKGSPVPYAPFDMTPCMTPPSNAKKPIAFTPVFLHGLLYGAFSKPESVAAAVIPVENTNGPILFVSGKDDQMWPASLLSEISVTRLKEHKHPFSFEHLCYDRAGHWIGIPNMPATETSIKHPVDGGVYELGGNPKDNAAASADSWQRIIQFFEKNLK